MSTPTLSRCYNIPGLWLVNGCRCGILIGWMMPQVNRWRMERNARLILVLSHLPTTCPRAILLTQAKRWLTVSHKKTISFSSSSCGQLWMSWGFPHMELKKHHHHHIICFSHLGIQNRHLVPITEFVLCYMSWNGLRYSDKLKAFHPERSKKGDISSRLWLLCMWCLSGPNG